MIRELHKKLTIPAETLIALIKDDSRQSLICTCIGKKLYMQYSRCSTPEQLSYSMSQIKSRNTKPELPVRRFLHENF
jgi:hypothetical protein